MALIYITGGAKSGKSKFAEEMLLAKNNGKNKNIYLATAIIYDEEMQTKVDLHKERRKDKWVTVECYKDFSKNFENILGEYDFKKNILDEEETYENKLFENENIKQKDNMLVDCLTNMITNIILEDESIDWDKPAKEQMKKCDEIVEKEVEKLLEACKEFENTVIVSNELGMGIVPATPLGRYFREIAGKMNQYVAEKADEAYLVVSGIPMKIK